MKAVKHLRRVRRHARIRSRIAGSVLCPRLSVFRSGKYLFVQLIDDDARKTLCAFSDKKIVSAPTKEGVGRKVAVAFALGKALAEKAKGQGITRVVFDRGGYAYHGRVQAIAEGAREGGLQF